MKIGLVLDDSLDKADGVQQYVITLGGWLDKQGHEVHYLAGKSSRRDISNLHSLSKNIGVRFNQNKLSTALLPNKKKIKTLLESEKYDLLHVQMPYSPILAANIIKYAPTSCAVVATFHILPSSKLVAAASFVLRFFTLPSINRIDRIFAVSQPAKVFARRAFGVEAEVVPNMITSYKFNNAKPFKELLDGTVNIVFLGRLVKRKGCLHLLKAINRLHGAEPDLKFRLIVCGSGPMREQLVKYTNFHNLNEYVSFAGYVSEIQKQRYLATADIAVFPSTGGESFGIVLLEAMAAGSKSIIAGNNPGYSSVLGNRQDSIIEPADTEAFMKILSHYASNPNARLSSFKWQKQHVKKFDVDVVGNRLLKCYQEVIAKRSC